MPSLWHGGQNMHEMRSEAPAGAQADWVNEAAMQGVGAWHGHDPATAGGGGYLDECTPLQLWDDAKFRELAAMGLPQVWLDVARDIGYEAFMRVWRRLDAATELLSDSESMIEVKLRRHASFQRFQRNRFIEALVDMGLQASEIRDRVARDIGDNLTLRHIQRIARTRRVTP